MYEFRSRLVRLSKLRKETGLLQNLSIFNQLCVRNFLQCTPQEQYSQHCIFYVDLTSLCLPLARLFQSRLMFVSKAGSWPYLHTFGKAGKVLPVTNTTAYWVHSQLVNTAKESIIEDRFFTCVGLITNNRLSWNSCRGQTLQLIRPPRPPCQRKKFQ